MRLIYLIMLALVSIQGAAVAGDTGNIPSDNPDCGFLQTPAIKGLHFVCRRNDVDMHGGPHSLGKDVEDYTPVWGYFGARFCGYLTYSNQTPGGGAYLEVIPDIKGNSISFRGHVGNQGSSLNRHVLVRWIDPSSDRTAAENFHCFGGIWKDAGELVGSDPGPGHASHMAFRNNNTGGCKESDWTDENNVPWHSWTCPSH